jgi:hypothetical protein
VAGSDGRTYGVRNGPGGIQVTTMKLIRQQVECACQCWKCRNDAHCGNIFFGCAASYQGGT